MYFEQLLALYRVRKHQRPSSEPRFGSPLERLFGTMETSFIYHLLGNTQASQHPRAITKATDPERHAVWTLPALAERVQQWADEEYDTIVHPALKMTPRDAYAQSMQRDGERDHKRIPYDDRFKQEWHEQAFPLYQPLVWMLQVVKICPRHRQWLGDRCPSCQMHQSAIGANMRLGHCTQCDYWLGMQPDTMMEKEVNDDLLFWQEWVVSTVGELHQASVFSRSLSWESFLEGLASCTKMVDGISHLAHIADISHPVLSKWLNRTRAPSLEVMLQCCYVLGVSPLQLMTDDPVLLRAVWEARVPRGKPLPRRSTSTPVDAERALAFIQAVLDGRGQLLSVHQIEQHLGLGSHVLQKKFPQECAMFVAKYRAYRNERARQRIAQTCTAVRQATLTVYEQGVTPTWKRVTAQLADPGMMRTPEGRATWHAVRKEIGLES